ncbi:MAG: hypothetical protein H7X86_06090, partial [Gorillibacterium sp.]|nr:hypothetical protein [Gorillibacterium sp.]
MSIIDIGFFSWEYEFICRSTVFLVTHGAKNADPHLASGGEFNAHFERYFCSGGANGSFSDQHERYFPRLTRHLAFGGEFSDQNERYFYTRGAKG